MEAPGVGDWDPKGHWPTPLGRAARWGSCFSKKSVPAQALARGCSPADLSWSGGFSGSLDCSCPLETYGPTGPLSPLHAGGLRTPCNTICMWLGSPLLVRQWVCTFSRNVVGVGRAAPTVWGERAWMTFPPNWSRELTRSGHKEVEMLDLRRTAQAHLGGERNWVGLTAAQLTPSRMILAPRPVTQVKCHGSLSFRAGLWTRGS